MTVHRLSYAQTHFFSRLVVDYVEQKESLQPFLRYTPTVELFEAVLKDATLHYKDLDREQLVQVLLDQYTDEEVGDAVMDNIRQLAQPTTFTVTTAHQPNVFTGPLFFIYKIVSTIRLSETLRKRYPNHRFTPVYWIGSEDHDFEEINHINLFGQTLRWEDEAGGRGPVGRLSTDTLQPVLISLKELLGNEPTAQDLWERLERAYGSGLTLAAATRRFVHSLFGKYGLVVLNQDEARFKKLFAPTILRELKVKNSESLVQQTNEQLRQAGYEPQAFPRPINLFYLTEDNQRLRIEWNETVKHYEVLNTELHFSAEEITKEVAEQPERFSPNVILRPVYQQTVLPNVAYVGGGGELAYWLQLKSVFADNGAFYPILLLRNSVLVARQNANGQRLEKLGLTIKDLFRPTNKLIVEYLNRHSKHTLNLYPQKELLTTAFEQILEKAMQIDPTLQSSVVGEMTKLTKAIENLEGKLLKAEKRKFETATGQIENLKQKLFPNNGLQERGDNFMPYYVKYGDTFIEELMEFLDVFEGGFLVLGERG